MADRLFLYMALVDLLCWLFSESVCAIRVDEVILDAASDPLLTVDDFALLLHHADQLLGR